jgi:hypothetical protein
VLCNRKDAMNPSSVSLNKALQIQSIGVPETKACLESLLSDDGFAVDFIEQESPITQLSVAESLRLGCVFPKGDSQKNTEMGNIYCLPSQSAASSGSMMTYIGRNMSHGSLHSDHSRRVETGYKSDEEINTHLPGINIAESPSAKILGTLESAVQLSYILATLFEWPTTRWDMPVLFRNVKLEYCNETAQNVTYGEYLEVMCRKEFNKKLSVTKLQEERTVKP